MGPDKDQIRQFLQTVVDATGGLHEIRTFGPDGGGSSEWVDSSKIEKGVDFVVAQSRKGLGCFLSVCPRKGRKKTAADTVPGCWFVVDFDKGGMTQKQVESVISIVLIEDVSAYMVVESSPGKWHLWLKANKAPEDVQAWVGTMKGLAVRCKSCMGNLGIQGVWRIPGVVHTKPEYKTAEGMPMVRLVEVRPDQVFKLSKLPREEVSVSEMKAMTKDTAACKIKDGSMSDITKQFLGDCPNEDLQQGSRNRTVKIVAGDMAGREWDLDEARAMILEAATRRGLTNKVDINRQIKNGFADPKVEFSSDEVAEVSFDEGQSKTQPNKDVSRGVSDQDDDDDEDDGGVLYDRDLEHVELAEAVAPPALDPAAFGNGLIKEIIATIEPETEAHPAAILVQLLTGIGNLAGKHPFFMVGAKKHYTNLFTMIVGDSSTGAKGDGLAIVQYLLAKVDQEWAGPDRQLTALASGEGLIAKIRDPEPIEDQPKSSEVVVEDEDLEEEPPFVERDPRLFVATEEFSGVLAACDRAGSTLADMLRKAFDSNSPLENPTKRDPQIATNHFISIVGHITGEELLQKAGESIQVQNGLLNRFLFCHSERTKVLSHPGDVSVLDRFIPDLSKSVEFISNTHQVTRSDEAGEVWDRWYQEQAKVGRARKDNVGRLIARGPAIVLRLSMIMALVDRRGTIEPDDLNAALAIWDYSMASAAFVYGANPVSMNDSVLAVITRNPGINKTLIRQKLGRAVNTKLLTDALSRGIATGMIIKTVEEKSGMGVDCFYPHDNPPAVVMTELGFRKSQIIKIVTEKPGLSRRELKNEISFHGAADLIAAMVTAGELRQEEVATGKRPRLEIYPVTKEEPVVEPSPRPEPKKPSPAKKLIAAGAVYENGQAPGEYDL